MRSLRRYGKRVWMGAALLTLGQMLGACASHVADMPVVGLPANTPERPAVAPAYLPVNDTPPPRTEAPMTPEQRAQLTRDLTAARDRQEGVKARAAKPRASNPPAN
ncbi:MAG: hypothetical protein J0G33_09770 [Afipia felis]|nr:hypothetical protein [Afipia felis]